MGSAAPFPDAGRVPVSSPSTLRQWVRREEKALRPVDDVPHPGQTLVVREGRRGSWCGSFPTGRVHTRLGAETRTVAARIALTAG